LPSEPNYFAFLSDLATELTRRESGEIASFGDVTIDVEDSATPYLLNAYAVNRGVRDAPATNVRYLANAASAPSLAEHLAERVKPHLERMQAAVDEFRDLTGCRLTVEHPGRERTSADADVFYADTERAVSRVLAEARRIPALQAAGRSSRFCALRVDVTGFGTYDDGVRPLSQAGDTLRETLRTP
jgi:hypothetical protein